MFKPSVKLYMKISKEVLTFESVVKNLKCDTQVAVFSRGTVHKLNT